MRHPRGGGAGLVIRDLTVRFGEKTAVEDLAVDVPTGSVLAVLGPSGCGKSTLLRAVAGLERPTAGTITYDGRDLREVPTHKRGFALMFQDGQLFTHLSAGENIAYPLRLRRRPRAEVRSRVEDLLELVSLPGAADRSVETLSGGERQRVALARALAAAPRLLLLDEPLSALDRDLRERLAVDLAGILRETHTQAVLVTHDQEEAFAVADRIAVLREGRLVQSGTLAEVWGSPADDWTARFLGYGAVVRGPAAVALGLPAGPPRALRRSALRLDEDGPVGATVVSATATAELTRLVLDVDGAGRLPGVAGPADDVRPGRRTRLRLDPDRVAVVASN